MFSQMSVCPLGVGYLWSQVPWRGVRVSLIPSPFGGRLLEEGRTTQPQEDYHS